ncbi:MAG: AAA family ATPase [Flavobacterium sp.]|uniref:AAA family ATPase n=2 Tax=Flavobacterium sp. TaxID=239 RepID=UPI0022C1DF6A|nr:AAA family ATPase [Flavobacterium sp.]MCZ8169313.1 AAA family ATPase [Flavobacterium sp.]MCZ8296053.1 AAA family ATPase [Flavobacterium sp.]
MKITKLKIDKHKHLENLEFDFTYPVGHPKAGKPLDKICFIGQSGTGKTNLLELISANHSGINKIKINENDFGFFDTTMQFDVEISFITNKNLIKLNKNELTFNDRIFNYSNSSFNISPLLNSDEKDYVYYFNSNLISNANLELLSKNPLELVEKYPGYEDARFEYYAIKEKPVNFDENIGNGIWLSIFQEILDYRKKFSQKMSDLIHKGLLAKTNKLKTEFDKWQKDNPNPLIFLAEKLNPILDYINIEIDVVNTEYLIPISNKKDEEIIPIQDTSTGTKGLLLSFLPLLKLKTSNSIILIDEPERSLYPDIQMKLMDYYKDFAPEAQFIVATHSPFIAASFEPEERFILYFDNEGKVAVRRGTSPIGDDPNDILTNDFGIDYINSYGQEKFQDYLELKQKMLFEENEELKKKYAQEVRELGDKYNF